MNPITITGALSMVSTNGDGAQLLTEAAEFLNALAQMGVQLAVEINLRPVAPATAQEIVVVAPAPYTAPATLNDKPAPSLSAAIARGSADDITLYEGHPSLAPVDPALAAPAQPDAPQWDLTPHTVRLRSDAPEWRKLSREQRMSLIRLEGCELARTLGHAPTMVEWDVNRPAEYPSASGVSKFLNMGWIPLTASWAQS